MTAELPPIILSGKELRKYRYLRRKYPVSREFLHSNWENAKRFIIYALNPHCVLRTYAWRKRNNSVVIVRRSRLLLFDPRLKGMIKRRQTNVKQWSRGIVNYYKKMGLTTQHEETELYGEELSKQMKEQLALLKSNKRGLSLIEDANKNVEFRLETDSIVEEQQQDEGEEKQQDEGEEKQQDEEVEQLMAQVEKLIADEVPEPKSVEEPANVPTTVVQPEKSPEKSPDKPGGSKFLDMLMNKVRVRNFAKEENFLKSIPAAKTESKPKMKPNSDYSFNDDTSEDFVGFDESVHQPGMLLTPLVPQNCKTLEGNGAFVSDALEAYMKKNNLREDGDRLLEPMYQDGRVTAHSMAPQMDMPAVPESLQRLRTVADRRQYLQRCKNQKMALINNEANIYRELLRKQRQRKVKIAAMQQLQSAGSHMPFTRQGWQAASYVATENDKYYYQVIRIDGEMVRLPGSQGNNAQREKQPHRSQLTDKEIALLQCSKECPDTALVQNIKLLSTRPLKANLKLQKLNQYPLTAIFRPCPLSQKPYQKPLDDDTAPLLLAGGSMAVVSMPTVQLDVKPQVGRQLDEIAKRYLQYILPHHDITREWAEFSVSTLQASSSRNSMREAEAQAAAQTTAGRRQSFTFVIPYLNDRNHILVRRVVDRSEQLDDSFSASHPPEKLQELEFRKELSGSADPIELDCADVINDMINTVAISCSENSFIRLDPEAGYGISPEISPIKEEIIVSGKAAKSKLVTNKPQQQQQRRPNKQQRLAKELRRLNATIIDAAAIAKDANKPCLKDFCQLGCLCDSLTGKLPEPEHCGQAACVLGCRCIGAELTRVVRVETDGRGISNEDAFNLRRKATARLAKMEKDFTSTLVLTDNETLLINETQCDKKRRCTKAPKRYEDFDDSIEDDDEVVRPSKVPKRETSAKRARVNNEAINCPPNEPCSVKDTDFVLLKHCQVSLRRLPDVANLATFCMTHQLYKCFCGGLAVEGKPVIIEKESEEKHEAAIAHFVPELATRAHYSFERAQEEPSQPKKRRKEKQQVQPQPKQVKPQAKTQSKQQSKPPTQVLSKPQTQVQPKQQTQVQPKQQTQVQPKQQTQMQPKQQAQVQPKQQTQVQPKQQSQALPKPQTPVDPKPQSQTLPKPLTQGQPKPVAVKKVQKEPELPASTPRLPVSSVLPTPPPPPIPTIKLPVASTKVPVHRNAEQNIIFRYFQTRPYLCRRAVSVPRNCYLRLNRLRAEHMRSEVQRAETRKTKETLNKRIASAVRYYRAELDQQRRMEQLQSQKRQSNEPSVIVVHDDDEDDDDDGDDDETGHIIILPRKLIAAAETKVHQQQCKRSTVDEMKVQLKRSAAEDTSVKSIQRKISAATEETLVKPQQCQRSAAEQMQVNLQQRKSSADEETHVEPQQRKRAATEETQPPSKRKRQLLSELKEKKSKSELQQPEQQQQLPPTATPSPLEIQMPKISSCYSLNTTGVAPTSSMDVGENSSSSSSETGVVSYANADDGNTSTDAVTFRTSYNDVIQKMNTHVSKKMQDIDLALQRESKIIPAPNEEILCIIKWTNFLAAFESDFVFIWDVQMTNYSFLAATVTNMMPAVCGAIAVVNTRFAADVSVLPLMARMLLESKRNENTDRLAVVMQGRQQYWLVKGFLRYMEGNACTKPTPQTHPILTKKINVLCTLMVKQRIREQHRRQLPLSASPLGVRAIEAAPLPSVTDVPAILPPDAKHTPPSTVLRTALTAPINSNTVAASTSTSTTTSTTTTTTTSTVTATSTSTQASRTKDSTLSIRSNIEFRKVKSGDMSELQIPELHGYDHRWVVLNLFDDFSHIFVPVFRDMISLDRIHNVVRVAHETKKVVKLQFFQDAPYDAFVTPSSRRKIYFGPLRLGMQPPVLVLLQSVDGKMMLREVYQREHGIPVQRERRTMAFWVLRINNQVHFEFDLTTETTGKKSDEFLKLTPQAKRMLEQQQKQQQQQLQRLKDDKEDDDDDDDEDEDEDDDDDDEDEDEDDDCMIIDDDDEEADYDNEELVDDDETEDEQEQEELSAKKQINHFTIQTQSRNGGGLHIISADKKPLSKPPLSGGFVPFIANVPATSGTAPSTQFLTPQVQLTQTRKAATESNAENVSGAPSKISRISVQRCMTPTIAATPSAAGAKEQAAPKINETLQQLLSGGNGNIKIGTGTTGVTITKLKAKDATSTATNAAAAVPEPISIGVKRKATSPPAEIEALRPTSILKQTGTTTSIGNSCQIRPVPPKLQSHLQQQTAARKSLLSKMPTAGNTTRVSLPAQLPPIGSNPRSLLSVAATSSATNQTSENLNNRPVSRNITRYGFMTANSLPRFRVKYVDGKFMVKISDVGVLAFPNCTAIGNYLNRHLSDNPNFADALPGEWNFLPFDNHPKRSSSTPQQKQQQQQQHLKQQQNQQHQQTSGKTATEAMATPIVIED